ncbi:MAG: efflux RND transporter periplasmic adaptor subunit [Planctomycetaceae bacterium]|nr:efflux RND transporter periplasmic adaptor subunit [Planctomycetaceae bacterium]
MTIYGKSIGFYTGSVATAIAVAVLLGAGSGCDRKAPPSAGDSHQGHNHAPGAHGEDDGHGHAAPAVKDAHGHEAHDGHDGHEAPATKPAAAAGEDDCCPPKGAVNLDEIEKKVCEHKIRHIDCDECRYELGVVKVDASVTDALITMATVEQGQQGRTLQLTGEVQYDQTTQVDVLPAAAGKIVSVKVRLGQRVARGDVLAVIHSGDFGQAKAAYQEAHTAAEVALQEKARQEAITSALERLLASATDKPGSDIPAETLGEWKSKLVGAVVRLRQAKVNLDREKSLMAKQATTRSDLETAQREIETTQADYAALLEEIQLNAKLDRLKAENAFRLAETKLTAAQQRLYLMGMDDEAVKAVPLMKENGRFAQLEVRAPRAGTIAVLNATEGRFVESSQSLFMIADTSNVWVWCDLYERDLGPLHARLAKGEKPQAGVKVAGFEEVFPGVADLLDSAMNESTRTVKARVQVKNDQGKLRPGMFASVEIPLTDSVKVALVPRRAVLSDEGRMFTFVYWKGDLWLRRDVSVGQGRGDMMEVLSGLSPGEKVVAGGGFLFKSDVLRAKMGAGCAD